MTLLAAAEKYRAPSEIADVATAYTAVEATPRTGFVHAITFALEWQSRIRKNFLAQLKQFHTKFRARHARSLAL